MLKKSRILSKSLSVAQLPYNMVIGCTLSCFHYKQLFERLEIKYFLSAKRWIDTVYLDKNILKY